jgi:hypothetical protein
MKRVLYDAVLREKLPDLESLVELCDEEGRVIARIVPVPDPSWYDLEPKISEEEWKKRLANPGKFYTTAEVLAYLETFEEDGQSSP